MCVYAHVSACHAVGAVFVYEYCILFRCTALVPELYDLPGRKEQSSSSTYCVRVMTRLCVCV